MNDDSTHETRRTVLQKSALAGSALTLGGVAFAGSAAADKPLRDDLTGLQLPNPCNDEPMTATRGKGVFDFDKRQDQSGGFHTSFKLFFNATFKGEETGQLYQGSLEASETINVTADAMPTTRTFVLREKIIGRGSAPNFLSKILAHVTVNANGVETVNIEMESEECMY